jgi:hypothetical protein
MNHELMGLTMMLRTVPAVCIALMVALSGMFPGVSRADNKVSPWPEKGEVDYRASYGEGGPVIGQGRYSWEHDGKKYQMRLALETTGVAAALYKLDYVQLSRGDIGKDGLRPQQFDVTHKGKTPTMALFDWKGARVSIRRGEKERHNLELTPGDQDILSIWRQIGHVSKLPDNLLIVANTNARRAQLTRLGDVELKVPAGRFTTRRFSSRSDDGKLKLDLWLAESHHLVPVRIILTDDKTGTVVFEATAIRVPPSN